CRRSRAGSPLLNVEGLLERAPLLREHAGRRVVVGCSGGADSLALVALGVGAGVDVVAVHVDHGLRCGSSGEFASVERAAQALGAQAAASRAVLVQDGPNLEARAREARYGALEAARLDAGAAVVMTAHTMDDQAETVLLALLRGSASAGLGGMAEQRDG